MLGKAAKRGADEAHFMCVSVGNPRVIGLGGTQRKKTIYAWALVKSNLADRNPERNF